MSTEKLIELSKPVAQIYYDELDSSVMRIGWFRSDEPKNPESLYSQEYVSALKHEAAVNWEAAASLNVENQELKKRIAELEVEGKVWESAAAKHLARAEEAEQRVTELSELETHNECLLKKNADLTQQNIKLGERLATPVRLPPPTAWMRGDDKTTFGPIFTKNKEYAESQWGDSAIALYSVPVGIKEAGFSDERNLMHINERGRATSLIWSKNNSENGDIQLFRLVGFTVEGGSE